MPQRPHSHRGYAITPVYHSFGGFSHYVVEGLTGTFSTPQKARAAIDAHLKEKAQEIVVEPLPETPAEEQQRQAPPPPRRSVRR